MPTPVPPNSDPDHDGPIPLYAQGSPTNPPDDFTNAEAGMEEEPWTVLVTVAYLRSLLNEAAELPADDEPTGGAVTGL